MLLGDAQLLDPVGEVDGRPDPDEHRPHRGALIPARAQHAWRYRDPDVLLDGHVGEDRRVLVHDGDAKVGGDGRVQGCDRLAGERDGSGVGLRGTGRDAHQGRLARAVLAEQSVDLTGDDIERHVRQRGHAGVRLADAAHDESRVMTHVDLRVLDHSRSPSMRRTAGCGQRRRGRRDIRADPIRGAISGASPGRHRTSRRTGTHRPAGSCHTSRRAADR